MAAAQAYPVRVDARLSRWLWLVKWILAFLWLLTIPQYIIIGVFTGGGGSWWGWRLGCSRGVLSITENYGAWGGLRVAGYAGLMTDRYPLFRLDGGGPDPGTLTLPPAVGPGGERPSTMTTAGAVLGWAGLIVPLAAVVILFPTPWAILVLILAISALVIYYARRNNRR